MGLKSVELLDRIINDINTVLGTKNFKDALIVFDPTKGEIPLGEMDEEEKILYTVANCYCEQLELLGKEIKKFAITSQEYQQIKEDYEFQRNMVFIVDILLSYFINSRIANDPLIATWVKTIIADKTIAFRAGHQLVAVDDLDDSVLKLILGC